MKAFAAGLLQETNIFSPIPTNRASFTSDGMAYYRPARGAATDPPSECLGYVDFVRACRIEGIEVVQGLYASAQPAAPPSREVYEALRRELLDDLVAASPVDMVFLMLHGAQQAGGYDDCEGDLLSHVRRIVDASVPVVALLDLHTNVTSLMLENATALIACKEYPHTDFPERAIEALDILLRSVSGEISPRMAAASVPLMGVFPTTSTPMAAFVETMKRSETGHIVSVSALHGFTGADTDFTRGAVIVVADGPSHEAADMALRIGDQFLRSAIAGYPVALTVDEALDAALAADRGPVVVADRTDNAGGGAASDSTFVLRRLLDRGIRGVALGMIWDPVTVQLAHAAGVGARLPLRVGGKVGPQSGSPVDLDAEVIDVRTDAKQAWFGQSELNQSLGDSAAIRAEGIDIIVNTVRQQVMSTHCFTNHGIDLSAQRIVVVKSTQHFHKGFEAVAASIIYCDAPGTFAIELDPARYRNIRRPIFPLDREGLSTMLMRTGGA